jgi:hypothetical protein
MKPVLSKKAEKFRYLKATVSGRKRTKTLSYTSNPFLNYSIMKLKYLMFGPADSDTRHIGREFTET